MAVEPAMTRMRIAVASEQSLVAEAVRAALASRGFDAVTLRWPGSTALRQPVGPRGGAYDGGLLLSELDRPARLRAATLLTQRVQTRWAVLTGAPRGPMWGAVLAAGAALVLPSWTLLDDVIAAVQTVSRGRALTPPAQREELVDEWLRLRERNEDLALRVKSLTPREREVLTLLHGGDTVADIAGLLEVAPATVRSQVKAVLRKLDVNSQLAAVAAFGSLLQLQRHEAEYDEQVRLGS